MAGRDTETKLEDALLKVALGFQVAEVTEEFQEIDGELKLTKRKRIKKDVPPDLKAVQMLLGENGAVGLEGMTDEQLEEEKKRLLLALSQAQTGKTKGQVCDETAQKQANGRKTAVRKPRAKPRKRVTKKKENTKNNENE